MPTMPSSIGKTKVTIKFVHHKHRIVRPMQVERILVGKISEIISHVAGETHDCWKPKKITVSVKMKYGRSGEPSSVEEITPMRILAVSTPQRPMVSMVRRPILPTIYRPNRAPATEIRPLPILPTSAASVLNPECVRICEP